MIFTSLFLVSDKAFPSQRQDVLKSATRQPRVSDKRNALWDMLINYHLDTILFLLFVTK